MREPSIDRPDHIGSYFRAEWWPLLLVTVSGLIYNVGLLAGPWFEGQMAQCLVDILGAKGVFADMLRLALGYGAVTLLVQGARCIKRLYVRVFANDVSRSMKQVLYGNLVHLDRAALSREHAGSLLTKAISDVDACAEGMRKFTTELFDTGVALLGYAVLLMTYDPRLALLCLLFPPISYVLAEKMKVIVQKAGAASKESAGQLSEATMDRVDGAPLYRALGCEDQRGESYEACLADYEHKAVRAEVWVSAMPPLYQIVSMLGIVLILYLGGQNVASGAWDIAAFTTFLSCFTKLSVKSSKAAKLFNAVQKAQVSWHRIKPLMQPVPEDAPLSPAQITTLTASALTFAYPGQAAVFSGLTFSASQGQIIGVTGPVACGKSALGKAFLCESPHDGHLYADGRELSRLSADERCALVGYLGHDPELMDGTIRDNVLLGSEGDLAAYLRAVCLDAEVAAMPNGADTVVGSGGVLLSGGQQQRLALARTLAHPRPILILDDPFSALDRTTEQAVFANLRTLAKDSIVLLLSHRLYTFPQADQVIWMANGQAQASTHDRLLADCPAYAALFRAQQKGGDAHAED